MKNPFFSIILPTYNRAHLLTKTINSVIEQDFENWELIVIDDGSTDNTENLVCSYEDARIKYHYQENQERSTARNLGIEKAEGSYICFLDSDDSFTNKHLSGFHAAILSNPTDEFSFYFCAVNRCIDGENPRPIYYDFDPSEAISFFAKGSIIPGQVCISKSILDRFKFDKNIVVVEDTDLWIRISFHFQCVYIPQASVNYYLHDENSVNVKNNAYLQRLNGLKRTFSNPEGKSLNPKLRREILSNCYFGIFKYHLHRNELFKARFIMFVALFKFPFIRTKEKIHHFLFIKQYLNE